MDIPPDIEIPEGMCLVLPYLRRKKKIERALIEVKSIFNRAARAQRLAEWKERWDIRERESLAFRLASRELFKQHGPTTVFTIMTLIWMPKTVAGRAHVYREHARFYERVNAYRRRFGFPPIDSPRLPSG